MSGRFPVHMYQTRAPQASTRDGMPTAVTTLAEKMKAAGYATVQVRRLPNKSLEPIRTVAPLPRSSGPCTFLEATVGHA